MRLILFILLILPIFVSSQEIKWGGYNQYKGNTIEILQNKTNFYTLRNKKTFIFNTINISKFEGFNQIYAEKINQKIGGRSASILGFDIFNDQPLIFLFNQFQNKKVLYIQKINNQGLAYGPSTEILQYEPPKSWFNKGNFSYMFSQNKKYLLIYYEVEVEKTKEKVIGYSILDIEFKQINHGVLSIKEDENNLYSYDKHLLNNGEFLLLKKINRPNELFLFKTYNQISDFYLTKIKGDSTINIPINYQSNKFIDLKIRSNDFQISIVGLYTRDESTFKIDGSYYFNYDYINDKKINEGFTNFNTDFITQNWSERAKKRALERVAKGKESPALYDYYIKDIIPLADSSLIFILEQFYISTITYTDPRTGYISTRYIYHYNDIIIGKINPKNEIAWMKMIPKSQVTENDNGYYSSFSNYCTYDKLTFYFNDISALYDKEGNYKEKSEFTLFNKRILAKAEIDLKTGNITRKNSKITSKRNEIAIPNLFSNNTNTNTFILFIKKGSKENFGIINY